MSTHKSRAVLCCCLSIALVLRIWLVIRTHGVIDGDEALVGIQAQHIVQGERPIYFYGQPYMGSLEAYLMSILFVFFGSSVWTLRAEPILLSLVLVWLTWKFAHVLAEHASLSQYPKTIFIFLSTLGAAILPLYDVVAVLHTLGGYIEIFIIMLMLLLSVLRLMDRWSAGAKAKELALRWCGFGFLLGLGFWVDPLVVYAAIAAALWIAWGIAGILRTHRFLLWKLPLAFVAVPSALIGGFPAIYWGVQHNWANVAYVFQQTNSQSLKAQLKTIWDVSKLYRTCVGPRVIGGGIPLEDSHLAAIHGLLYSGTLTCIGAVIVITLMSFLVRSSLLVKIRRVVALPLIFAVSTVAIFCASSTATNGLGMSCDTDFVGRYASPILVTLPLLVAALVTALVIMFHRYRYIQWVVLGLYVLSLAAQAFTYTQTSPALTFQSPYCLHAPANDDPVIAYMQREHIRYAWATNFVGNPITFKTNAQIIAIDPTGFTLHQALLDRIPPYTQAVEHADRPTILLLVASHEAHPVFLQQLDHMHITYRVARFPAEPHVDLIVVTPLNRNVPITTDPLFYGMFICRM